MKRVREMRNALERIPGALTNEPGVEWHAKGNENVLWQPLDGSEAIATIDSEEPQLRSSDELIPIVELPPDIDADISAPLLGDLEASDVRARVQALGVDALAWYMPFHQERYQWGCYLSLKGICAFTDALLPLHLAPSRRFQLAVLALLRHEATHFAVEYMAAQWELSIGKPCYWLARTRLKDAHLGFFEAEEKLANAYMLRGFRFPGNLTRSPGAMDLIRRYTIAQPPGYRHGQRFIAREPFQGLMTDVAHEYALSFAAPTYKPDQRGLDLLSNYPDRTFFDNRYVPVFLVNDTKLAVAPNFLLRFITRVERIDELTPFKKKLARMSIADQQAWEQTKRKLSNAATLPSLNFKPWRQSKRYDNVFSVRVTNSIRAHLRLDGNARWSALEIGYHTEMGHD